MTAGGNRERWNDHEVDVSPFGVRQSGGWLEELAPALRKRCQRVEAAKASRKTGRGPIHERVVDRLAGGSGIDIDAADVDFDGLRREQGNAARRPVLRGVEDLFANALAAGGTRRRRQGLPEGAHSGAKRAFRAIGNLGYEVG